MNFISAKDDSDEERVVHSKSDNMEIMTNDKADKVTEEFLNHSKIDVKILLYYKCQNKSE